MSDYQEPTWSKAWENLQRIKDKKDFLVIPPEAKDRSLEDRLLDEQRKKPRPSRGRTGVDPDGGPAYGITPSLSDSNK